MKKIFTVILTLIMVVMISGAVYAAQGGTTIPDQPVPGAPAQNVDNETYNPPEVQIFDPELPGGAAKTTDIKDDILPKTGGVPAETFYAAGGLMIAAALFISLKKTTKS